MRPSKQKRHIGKLLKIRLDHCEVVALCIWHTDELGYLLKWFEKDICIETLNPVQDEPFMYAFVPLDQAMRRGVVSLIKRLDDFEAYRPLMRGGGGQKPGGGHLPWYLEYNGVYERVSAHDPRLPSLSDTGLAGLGFIDFLYLHNRTPEVQFAILSGVGRLPMQ
ncbi:hypothetical protein RZ517_13040 [Roseovarius sp. S88]|uniref:Uncharacterized protein n=1 Tax=Roseovarius phycicola TaxID=3080976 RepID=A0ABZ2HGW7_9RHOB